MRAILSYSMVTKLPKTSSCKKKNRRKEKPEPFSSSKKKGSSLLFVVQKHAASHLHYDFRLEVDGVLKSWAVPKGPSMNPQDKRLAIMVEDHPFSYHNFEGIIPEGNYGAGTVMVWDTGFYYPINEKHEIADEKTIKKGIHNGKIFFALEGKKLQGLFSLIKLKNGKENQWLLIKVEDQFSGEKDILKKDRSVLSNKTMKQLCKGKDEPEN